MLQLKDLIVASLGRTKKTKSVESGIVFDVVKKVFFDKKGIDIHPYIISTQVDGNRIIIKTQKPLINSELLILEPEIKKALYERFQSIGLKKKEFVIYYK